ncbi:MAG: flavin reductase family protein, partial [Chloroflexota bacterium]
MPISPDQFKDALRHFAAGVTIVTVKAGEDVHGLTVSAFVSISAEPPLIGVIVYGGTYGHELLERSAAVFAVNILKEGQNELSDRFAWKEDRFEDPLGEWGTATTGAPVLLNGLAWLDCSVHSRVQAGSHTVYIGKVQESSVVEPDQNPLVYWNRKYR